MRVKDQIRNEIANLAGRKYDHDGYGGLPIRPDVAFFAANHLFASLDLGLDTESLEHAGEPSVLLDTDGTIELSFTRGGRELLLSIHCGGVVAYIKTYEDGQTSIEGVLRSEWSIGETGFEPIQELNMMLEWVATGATQ